MMGTLLIIMALAFALNDFLVEEKIPDMAVEMIRSMELGPLEFLLIVNLMLLVVGALMDSISAIMIIAPLLKPIADQLGIDPVHLGVVFIVNLEIGYLTPPIGINLFVASSVFKKPLGEVIRSVLPFIGIMFVGLAVVTYVPTVAMGPVNLLLRDEPFYEPLPEVGVGTQAGGLGGNAGGPGQGAGNSGEGREVGRSMAEMNEVSEKYAEDLYILCEVAQTVVDAELPAGERPARWKSEVESEDVSNAQVLELAAMVETGMGDPGVYPRLVARASELIGAKWTCEALEQLLSSGGAAAGGDGAGAKADAADGEAGVDGDAGDGDAAGADAKAGDGAEGDPDGG